MAELKPGGLALVIAGPQSGACVTTEFYVRPGQNFNLPDGRKSYNGDTVHAWFCTGRVKPRVQTKHKNLTGFALFTSEMLLPIEGDEFQHKDEQQKELTHG